MKYYKQLSGTIILSIALSFVGCKIKVKTQTPNILLFVGDDMTWRDCSPYGNKDVITPNIQSLANEGMCFDNMHTTTAMCAPTRQQLFSGLYPVRSGAYPNHSEMYEGTKSFASHFNELNYRTGLIGKVHQGPESSFPYTYFGGRHHDSGKGRDIELKKIRDFMVEPNDKPYFLVVAQNQPHSPWNRGDASQYEADKLTVPEYFVDTKATRDLMTKYYAEITYADSLLGVCLDFVKQSGQEKNTIVIFTSEQGASFPFGKWTCYDLGLKTAFIIRWPGKIEPKTRNNALTQYVDVLPTLLDLVGTNPLSIETGNTDGAGNKGFDGKSFKYLLSGSRKEHLDYVYGLQTSRGIYYGNEAYAIRSVRDKKYKYIWNIDYTENFSNMVTYSKRGIYNNWKENAHSETEAMYVDRYVNRPDVEFYDIINDPNELHNLAQDPKRNDNLKKYRKILEQWMQQQGDKGHSTEMEAKSRQVSH